MTVLAAVLAVMLLTDPGELVDAEAAAAVSEDADRIGDGAVQEEGKALKIRSRTSDFDRGEGVVMFEGDVVVDYGGECTMCSERVFVFLAGSNELSRVVALGGVTVTNESRSGSCAMATYRRRTNEIEMFAEAGGPPARLEENDGGKSVLEGSRVRFWLDSEQVEVENSAIEVEKSKEARL